MANCGILGRQARYTEGRQESQMSHIFIGYSHDDSDDAHKLEEALERRGFEVWIDLRIDCVAYQTVGWCKEETGQCT